MDGKIYNKLLGEDFMEEAILKAAKVIKESRNMIALTGAGISVESGIPDFRSAGGLWEKYDPAIYASIDTFRSQPERCWDMIFDMLELTGTAQPNPAHRAMAELEEMGHLKAVITQNIDNLHQKGGSKNVIEYHGNSTHLVCLKCHSRYEMAEFDTSRREPPLCKKCGAVLKPSIVFFGEMIPQAALVDSSALAHAADVVLVAGTSAVVYPAAAIPYEAKQHGGAVVIESNVEETSFSHSITDIFLKGPSGEILPRLLQAVKDL